MSYAARTLFLCLTASLAAPSFADKGEEMTFLGKKDLCQVGLLSFGTVTIPDAPRSAPRLTRLDQSPYEGMSTDAKPEWDLINRTPVFALGRDDTGVELFLITDAHLAQEVLKAPQTAKYVPQQRASSAAPLVVREQLVGGDIFLGDGERWEFIRRLLQPEFTPRAVRSRTTRIAGVIEDFQKSTFDRLARSQESFDLFPLLHQMAFDVLLQTAFGLNDRETMQHLFTDWSFVYYELNNLAPLRADYPPERRQRFEEARQRVNQTIAKIIAQRRAQGNRLENDNLLTLMINSSDETGQPLSDERIMGELRTLFTAGSDTTAGLTFWALTNLLKNPPLLAEVRDEIRRMLHGEPLNQDNLRTLHKLKATVQETLRLHPGLPRIYASFSQDVLLAGYLVPQGSRLVIRLDLLHENPKYWSHPERFDPSRFLDNGSLATKGCFIPFGSGPRACLGRELAITESMSTLVLLLNRYDWTLNKEPRSTDLMGLVRYPDQLESGRFSIARKPQQQ